jgi:hypothetical protein
VGAILLLSPDDGLHLFILISMATSPMDFLSPEEYGLLQNFLRQFRNQDTCYFLRNDILTMFQDVIAHAPPPLKHLIDCTQELILEGES